MLKSKSSDDAGCFFSTLACYGRLCHMTHTFYIFFWLLLLFVSDPSDQLCHGAKLGLSWGLWWRRQHRHHARELLRYHIYKTKNDPLRGPLLFLSFLTHWLLIFPTIMFSLRLIQSAFNQHISDFDIQAKLAQWGCHYPCVRLDVELSWDFFPPLVSLELCNSIRVYLFWLHYIVKKTTKKTLGSQVPFFSYFTRNCKDCLHFK